MTLNARQEAFVREYLLDGNGTQAALRAGYSPRAAKEIATENLTKPAIAEAVAAGRAKLKIASQFSVEATHDEIRALAHSDPRSVFNDDGTIKKPSEWTDEIARCIAGFEVVETYDKVSGEHTGRIVKIKLWPKDNVLTLKAKVQKLVTDRVEHSLDQGTADALMKARERRNATKVEDGDA